MLNSIRDPDTENYDEDAKYLLLYLKAHPEHHGWPLNDDWGAAERWTWTCQSLDVDGCCHHVETPAGQFPPSWVIVERGRLLCGICKAAYEYEHFGGPQ